MRPDVPDGELERRLRGLEPAWPATPDVAGEVGEELRARERLGVPPRRPARPRSAWALPAAAAAILALTAFATVAVIRAGGVAITLLPGTPSAPPSFADPFPDGFGLEVSLDEVPEVAGFVPIYPSELGPPDAVWVDHVRLPDGGRPVPRVAMAWRADRALPPIVGSPWGALLFESPGDAFGVAKTFFDDVNTIRPTKVNGQDGYYATGPHPIELATSGEPLRYEVNGNLLLWNEGDYAMRLESLLAHREAVRVAESVRS